MARRRRRRALYSQLRAFEYHRDDARNRVVRTVPEFHEAINWLSKHRTIACDTETSGLAYFKDAAICGVAMGAMDGGAPQSYYFPIRHQTGEAQLPVDTVLAAVGGLLRDPARETIWWNNKFDRHMFNKEGIEIAGPVRDAMFEANFYDENTPLGLDERAHMDLGDRGSKDSASELNRAIARLAKESKCKIKEYKNRFGYARVSVPLCGVYACGDVGFTLRLAEFYDRKNVRQFFRKILDTEIQLIRVLCEMEENGLPVNQDYLMWLAGETETAMEALLPKLKAACESDALDPASDASVVDVLQGKFGCALSKETKASKKGFRQSKWADDFEHTYAVDADVLETLPKQYPQTTEFCALLLEWREAAKIRGTYTTSILEHVGHDGCVHGNFKQLGTLCMPAGVPVLTHRGYLPVERVEVGDQVITHEGRARPVVTSAPQGKALVIRVRLTNGMSLRTTWNHAYKTPTGWCEARHLWPGDVVVVHSGKEDWRPVRGWKLFQVSSWGRVKNIKTQTILAQQPKGRLGHLKVLLHRKGAQQRGPDRKDFAVHRLVAIAFCQKRRGCSEVRHINGIAWDNTAGNLAWSTLRRNRQDAIEQGTSGRRHGKSAKMTVELAASIRASTRSERSDRVWAELCGVSRELVSGIRAGKRWGLSPVVDKRAAFSTSVVLDVLREPVEVDVYGLTVAEDHSHVTGGIVTHNTGRMACEKPNLQNVGKDSNTRAVKFSGKKLKQGGVDPWSTKRAFTNRGPGKIRVYKDYSQAELRVLAHVTQDPTMMSTFLNPKADIHSEGALEMFGSKEPEFRDRAKTIIFGLSYGLQPDGYARQVGVTKAQAELDYARFFKRYPRIPAYKEEFFAECRGRATSTHPPHFVNMFGRPRRVALMNAADEFSRARGDRQMFSTNIQGTAAEWTKESLVRIWLWEQKARSGIQLCQTIHDEISTDMDKSVARDVMRAIVPMMESFPQFDPVPILIDANYSDTDWSEKKAFPEGVVHHVWEPANQSGH